MANQQNENDAIGETGASSGDEAANRLGGEQSRAGMSGGGAATGDMDAGRSEGADAGSDEARAGGGTDAGSPGGMGGAASRMPNPDHRPNGGVSPLQNSGGDKD